MADTGRRVSPGVGREVLGPGVFPGQRCGDRLEGRGKDRGRTGPVVEGAAVRHSRRRPQGVGSQEPEVIYISEDDTARPTPAGRRALLHDPGEGGGPGVGMEEQLPPRAEWPPSEFGEKEGAALPPAAPRNFPVDGRELSYSPQRADEGEKEKGREAKKRKKKAKDKVRVLEMLKQSRWSWRESSLDPEFKRPKIKLRRGKGDSDSISSSSHSGGGPESKVQDGAPAVQEDPVQWDGSFACQQGAGARHGSVLPPVSLASQPVAPIGERGFVALCGHGPALRGGGRPRAGCQHATPEIPRSHHARETPGGGIKDGVDPGDPQQRGHRRGAPYGCKRAEAGRAFAGLRGEAPLNRGQWVSKRSL